MVYAADPTAVAVRLHGRYRRKALTAHPDKGGTVEAFRDIQVLAKLS